MDGMPPPHLAEAEWKIGVDIGGTFMDFCALETRSGRIASLKVLTTPDDPGAELLTGLDILPGCGHDHAVRAWHHGGYQHDHSAQRGKAGPDHQRGV
jgi:hypothetical protein